MGIQTRNGKAFEYACLQSLNNALSGTQKVVIEQNSALEVAMEKYHGSSEEMRNNMDLGADAATRVILRLEPQLTTPLSNVPLFLAIQEDARGQQGDVRDVLCIRRQNEWEIGLSCKHNHTAVKHSRLSRTIDFGDSWFGIPSSQDYFDEINPLFDELDELKERGELWRNIENKEERIYVPLLKAFIRELERLNNNNPGLIPERLLQYLLGSNDFYKVITHDRRRVTQVQAFNLYGTLNRNSGRERPIVNVPQLIMPTRFFDISFKRDSRNTIEVTCDNGWTVSLRIHNASSRVEPSLKFDVRLTGVPPYLHTHFEAW
ncbi:restriction endonuclease (HaeIII) [Halalkalibacterium halodurans C-125]|uniref:Restriction endonuclease (HaeIII) n=1 Tax=Halalkalibacterium halodurans (strain ATCC BAA-125 / DSM 18197 / FERM 7344 / JCM 9153 / C-125) TaxID=272558 RepID=Q9K764_HALH5|nr:HaeIII family restriction endonuclease [Halalkalibacterium halodurans]BAB07228.1 restriction endonuclease (HaeIII) [Halalkalibacterium halodurans C-125]